MATTILIAWCLVFAMACAGLALRDVRWIVGPLGISLVMLVLTLAHR